VSDLEDEQPLSPDAWATAVDAAIESGVAFDWLTDVAVGALNLAVKSVVEWSRAAGISRRECLDQLGRWVAALEAEAGNG
jgi:hypothetical protein